jgi:hypothetical protein
MLIAFPDFTASMILIGSFVHRLPHPIDTVGYGADSKLRYTRRNRRR